MVRRNAFDRTVDGGQPRSFGVLTAKLLHMHDADAMPPTPREGTRDAPLRSEWSNARRAGSMGAGSHFAPGWDMAADVGADRSGLKAFHPGWAGLGLGTGGLGTATAALRTLHPNDRWVTWLAAIVLLTGLVGSFAAIAIHTVRFRRHRGAFASDWSSPSLAPAFVMAPAGVLACAIGMRLLAGLPGAADPAGPLPGIAAAAGIAGAALGLLALLTSVATVAVLVGSIMIGARGAAAGANGTWLVPGTALMLGSIFCGTLFDPAAVELGLLAIVDAGLLGAGLTLTVLTLSLIAWRLLAADEPPPGQILALMTVTSPLSVGAIAILALAQRAGGDAAALAPVARLVSTGLLGAAAGWLPIAIGTAIARRSFQAHGFTPAWWAYVFPTAAFAEASLLVGASWSSPAMGSFGVALWGLVVVIWLVCTALAVRDLAQGRWVYPP